MSYSSQSLPYDKTNLETLILFICDKYDFRVEIDDSNTNILLVLGCRLAGGYLGHKCGGKVGAAIGGAVGGALGVKLTGVPLMNIWEDVKSKLKNLFMKVYDFLAGLRMADYDTVMEYLTEHSFKDLDKIIIETVSKTLGVRVLSNLTAA